MKTLSLIIALLLATLGLNAQTNKISELPNTNGLNNSDLLLLAVTNAPAGTNKNITAQQFGAAIGRLLGNVHATGTVASAGSITSSNGFVSINATNPGILTLGGTNGNSARLTADAKQASNVVVRLQTNSIPGVVYQVQVEAETNQTKTTEGF